MKCPYCGREIEENEKYCTYCGHKLTGRKKKKHGWGTAAAALAAAAAVVIIALLLRAHLHTYPKGMYVMYDAKGRSICQLSLRSSGTYELIDLQNYSSVDDESDAPVVVFHHNFSIGREGLTWDQNSEGRMEETDQPNIYLLKNFFGGLYDEAEDACLYYAGDSIYLYPESDSSEAYIMVVPQ